MRAALRTTDVVLFYGHGDAASLFGFGRERVVTLADAVLRLRSKLIFTVACSSARALGRAAVLGQAMVYFGYTRKYYLWDDADGREAFREVANAPAVRMIRRHANAGDALTFTRAGYLSAIDYYLRGPGRENPNAGAIAADLGSNLVGLVFRGSPSTVL